MSAAVALLPALAWVALEITRPLVFLQKGGVRGPPLLPRPHWGISLAYWVAASALFILIAVGALVSSTEALLALTLAALYNLLAYHSGAELTGAWASARFRALQWPSPSVSRILYELPAPSVDSDPELTRTWRCTVARYEPRRLFSQEGRPATETVAGGPVLYYGNAGWYWAAFFSARCPTLAGGLRIGLASPLPFAIPVLREAALLSGCVSVPWDCSAVQRVYVDVSKLAVTPASTAQFVAVARADRKVAIGLPHQQPGHAERRWQDLHAPLSVVCKWQ